MRDIEIIDRFCDKVGGLSAGARALTTPEVGVTVQNVYNWLRRGRVAPEMRLHFLTMHNRLMPKSQSLPLSFLAVPATDPDTGVGNGRKSRRQKTEKPQGQKARRKRGAERVRA